MSEVHTIPDVEAFKLQVNLLKRSNIELAHGPAFAQLKQLEADHAKLKAEEEPLSRAIFAACGVEYDEKRWEIDLEKRELRLRKDVIAMAVKEATEPAGEEEPRKAAHLMVPKKRRRA